MFGLRRTVKKRRPNNLHARRALGCEQLEARIVLASYHLTFNDEFNAFNSSRWRTSDFWGMRNNPGDYQGQWFSDTANNGYNPFNVSNGVLSIQARPTPAGVGGGQPYVSGQLTTAHLFTQLYGYFELRAKTPPGSGLWSRFWLLTDDGNWPGEYDVLEILGKETNKVHQTTHYRNVNGNHAAQGSTYTAINPTDGFHTYGFLWEPTGVTWFVDGIATQTQINRIDKPMYILIDLAVGNDPNNLWPGNPNSSTAWPANFELDYFRVYSADPSLPSVVPDAGYSPSTLPNGHTVEVTSTSPPRPIGWTAGDLGTPNTKGSATWNPTSGEWMLKGAGFGIAGFGDQGHYASTSLSGDGAVTATVLTVTAMNSNDVKAGVMIRESTAANARAISLFHTTSFNNPNLVTGIAFQSRSGVGGTTTTLATVTGMSLPATLRLSRVGNTFTASYSSDGGTTWTTIGTPQTIAMANTVQAGLAIGGNQNNYLRLSRATFKDVSVGPLGQTNNYTVLVTSDSTSVPTGRTARFVASVIDPMGNAVDLSSSPVIWTVVSGGGSIAADGTYTAPAMVGGGMAKIRASFQTVSDDHDIPIVVPSPWTAIDINATPSGDTGELNGNWDIVAGGTGLEHTQTSDSFRFVNQPLSGDVTAIVKLNSRSTTAGIMLREAQSNAASYAAVWLNSRGVQWVTREGTGTFSALRTPTVLNTTMPVWLRLVRSGNTFTASYSYDAIAWNILGSRSFSMNTSARIGLASGSGNASFSNFSISEPPLLRITPATFSSSEGSTVLYDMVLSTQPSANVVVALTGASSQATLNASTFTFTPANWNVPQAVSVLLKEDYIVEGQQSLIISHSVASTDPAYNQVNAPTMTITFSDGTDPSIVSSSNMILENSAVGSIVGSLSVTNAVPTESYQFSLVPSVADNEFFSIVGNELRTTQSFDFETKSSYTIRLRAIDSLGISFERVLQVQVGDATEISSRPVIANGSLQRSTVRNISFQFDRAITYQSGAFEVVRRGGAGGIVDVTVTNSIGPSGKTTVNLTFSGALTRNNGALLDGNYELRIYGTKITGWSGSDYTFGSREADKFFAYFGDTNGDRTVGASELVQFRSSYLMNSTNPRYNANFDYDGASGAASSINMTDFMQFRLRYAKRFKFA